MRPHVIQPGLPTRTSPDPDVLDDLVRRIVEVAAPEKIILFGSAAKGEMGPHSDLDVLVVRSGDYRKLDISRAIHQNLFGLGEAVDVIVATPEELERFGDCFALVYYPALREGRVLYST